MFAYKTLKSGTDIRDVVNWLILNTMNVVLNVKQQYLNSKKSLISKHLVNWTSGRLMPIVT